MTRIVVVEDEPDLREAVVDYLLAERFAAIGVGSGVELDASLARARADLVVLDVNLPGEDGFSIAQRLRAAKPIGIIMLTSRSELIDRVLGLELGADDYISKPFAMRELLARIRTVLRRLEPRVAANEMPLPTTSATYAQSVWVDAGTRRVRVDLDTVDLITACKDYVVLHSSGGNFVLRHTIKAFALKLDPATFVRVHRSAIVRPAAVVDVRQAKRAVYATLRNGERIPVTFEKRRLLENCVELLRANSCTI